MCGLRTLIETGLCPMSLHRLELALPKTSLWGSPSYSGDLQGPADPENCT